MDKHNTKRVYEEEQKGFDIYTKGFSFFYISKITML